MVARFASPEAETYLVMGEKVKLKQYEDVFSPSSHGLAFANSGIIEVHGGETWLDAGSGSGVLGIAAKIKGAFRVIATDPNPRAIRATQLNAELNNVVIETRKGKNFAGLEHEHDPDPRKFDAIIANLPQDIIAPRAYRELPEYMRLAIAGGTYGDDLLKAFLKLAPLFMHNRSRLYIPTYTGAQHKETEAMIQENFTVQKMHTSVVECKHHVAENLDFYQKLAKRGIIEIFQMKNKHGVLAWHALQHEYELGKKRKRS